MAAVIAQNCTLSAPDERLSLWVGASARESLPLHALSLHEVDRLFLGLLPIARSQ